MTVSNVKVMRLITFFNGFLHSLYANAGTLKYATIYIRFNSLLTGHFIVWLHVFILLLEVYLTTLSVG